MGQCILCKVKAQNAIDSVQSIILYLLSFLFFKQSQKTGFAAASSFLYSTETKTIISNLGTTSYERCNKVALTSNFLIHTDITVSHVWDFNS